ncbi:hypothetical protein [Asticcacaulis sp.]|uniref:hypothetical protein n=1 Tax=Asticcacaulis sp. TaxID=1872648 RepID=UPI003918F114
MNWKFGAAIVAALVVVCGGVAAAPRVEKPQGPTKVEVVNTAEAPAKVEVVNTIQTSEASTSWEPTPLERKCAEGSEDRQSDLCAQWKAADAAMVTARWAQPSFYLSLTALIFSIFGTFALIVALADGRKSAAATVKALDIGRAQIIPTETTGRGAVIKLDDGSIAVTWIDAWVKWHNVGERIAIKVAYETGISIEDASKDPILPYRTDQTDWKTLRPKDRPHSEQGVFHTDGDPVPLNGRKFYAWGNVTYCDTLNPDKVWSVTEIFEAQFDGKIPSYLGIGHEFTINELPFKAVHYEKPKRTAFNQMVFEMAMRVAAWVE